MLKNYSERSGGKINAFVRERVAGDTSALANWCVSQFEPGKMSIKRKNKFCLRVNEIIVLIDKTREKVDEF